MNHAEVARDVVLGDESGGADGTALLLLVDRVHMPLEGLLGVQLGVAGHALGGGGALRAGQVLHLVVDPPDVDVQVGLDHKGLATQRAHVSGRGRRVTVSFMAKGHVRVNSISTRNQDQRGRTGGAWPLPIFGATKTSAFSTNAQLRFGSFVFDGVLGPL